MNVLTKIGYDNLTVEIEFPIDDDSLEKILRDNYMPTDTTKPFYVRSIDYPNALSGLEGRTVNLDELNFLAKRMECFFGDEYDQFSIAVERTIATNLRDMINLTFNLDKYTLIKDISDMTKVGREYVLNTEGGVPVDSKYDEKYAQIGRDLLNSGRGIFTEKGLLFVENKPLDEVYDGQVFPEFAYNAAIADVEIEYNGKMEILFLPDSELAFGKALNRLGAKYLEDCDCVMEILDPKYNNLSETLDQVFTNKGINELNRILKRMDDEEINPQKLAAAIEYTGVTSPHDIGVLMDNIDDLELITDIDQGDYDEVGRYFINASDDYELSEELEDFFDIHEFGEYIADERSGQFISGGFIYYDGNYDMTDILDQLDSAKNSIKMGGL
ncbi:hypothetical protein [Ruminococcus sp.]|uniref:hypothetical protein n=1 Tax=Ruminococcus sp. TaxID=41978 RepID=UPI00388E5D58